MAKRKPPAGASAAAAQLDDYRHTGATRKNNPPAKIAAEGTVPAIPKAQYAYNPHLPPVLRFDAGAEAENLLRLAQQRPLGEAEAARLGELLQRHEPWLEWSGKREAKGFEVDPVALHIHERISAQAILKVAARQDVERSLFGGGSEQAYHEAVQFYRHDIDWTNRLILGDSLAVMSSLAKREDLAGRVQMIYLDPPYGIKFASNFQPEIGRRDVKDKEQDLTREPEMVRAYRDTWQLGIHSYLSYLRDRLIAARELLADAGSIFVQIGEENLHRVQAVLDDVFGAGQICGLISFRTTSGQASSLIASVSDYVLWYARDREKVRYRQLHLPKVAGGEGGGQYTWLEKPGEVARPIASQQGGDLSHGERLLRPADLSSSGFSETLSGAFAFRGTDFLPPSNTHWKTTSLGLRRLSAADRIIPIGKRLYYKRFIDDFAVFPLTNLWLDTGTSGFGEGRMYVVQTNPRVIERCMLMTTDPGDLVLDPTCGSGTTAYVAEQWGRRWITIDTSRVAVAIARQRLLTAKFDYYRLKSEIPNVRSEISDAKPQAADGPAAGFVYKTVPHVTLKSIAQNVALDPIFARHEPLLDAALAEANAALAKVDDATKFKLLRKLADKQKFEGKKAVTDADRRRWILPGGKSEILNGTFEKPLASRRQSR